MYQLRDVLTLSSGKVLDIPRLSNKVVTTKLQPESKDNRLLTDDYTVSLSSMLRHIVVYCQLAKVYTITDFICQSSYTNSL